MNRMAVGGVAGPLGAPAVPMPMAWARKGPPKRAPQSISVSARQTLKYATGATAPVAPSHSAGSITSRHPRGKGVFPWAGGRSFGDRPPAQGKTHNTLRGLLTAERYNGGGILAGGLRRPPESESPPLSPKLSLDARCQATKGRAGINLLRPNCTYVEVCGLLLGVGTYLPYQ
ncbi:hypothetical protein NDU88_002603 [Pleurodeles waltl]|uniref:Uncharacterized protein n=1 Tax=Pleurodeles waltl TaxID=8319 RepID=A0AAV7NNM1_PLEWA|nr:hypothetical protein NDU88_002603 [Pleurodeles waltl]